MDFISITRIWEQLLFNIRWLIYYLWWSIANRNSHFSFFASYERSECFIFGVKRKMLHSGMKWSCFIVRRFLWSILRRCRKIWSASCDAWSGTACHEAKPDGFIPPFFNKKMAEREGFEPSVSCPTAVFKTAALNHSTISPRCSINIAPFYSFVKMFLKK